MGQYTQQDPIGMAGGNPTLYGYVENTLGVVDVFGLIPIPNMGIGPQHGGVIHNNVITKEIGNLPIGAQDIRKNQWQVDVKGEVVGRNRPDIQYNLENSHYNMEVDTKLGGSLDHQTTIKANDPNAKNIFKVIDEKGSTVSETKQNYPCK
jgi:uncharacterized protein RhaS with RHS repeats